MLLDAHRQHGVMGDGELIIRLKWQPVCSCMCMAYSCLYDHHACVQGDSGSKYEGVVRGKGTRGPWRALGAPESGYHLCVHLHAQVT